MCRFEKVATPLHRRHRRRARHAGTAGIRPDRHGHGIGCAGHRVAGRVLDRHGHERTDRDPGRRVAGLVVKASFAAPAACGPVESVQAATMRQPRRNH